MNIRSTVGVATGAAAATGGRSPDGRPASGKLIGEDVADRVAATFATLADPTRARLLHALTLTAELTVSDLAELLGMSQSAVSHQLRSLRDNHVVQRRRAGRVAYYRLADAHVRHILADAVRHATEPHPHPAGHGLGSVGAEAG